MASVNSCCSKIAGQQPANKITESKFGVAEYIISISTLISLGALIGTLLIARTESERSMLIHQNDTFATFNANMAGLSDTVQGVSRRDFYLSQINYICNLNLEDQFKKLLLIQIAQKIEAEPTQKDRLLIAPMRQVYLLLTCEKYKPENPVLPAQCYFYGLKKPDGEGSIISLDEHFDLMLEYCNDSGSLYNRLAECTENSSGTTIFVNSFYSDKLLTQIQELIEHKTALSETKIIRCRNLDGEPYKMLVVSNP